MEASHSGILAVRENLPAPLPINVTACALPFGERVQKMVSHGGSLADILRDMGIEEGFWPYLRIDLNGAPVVDNFQSCVPLPGSVLVVSAVVQGGGFRRIARIVVSVAIAWAAPQLSAALLSGVLFSSQAVALAVGGLVSAAIGTGLSSVTGALFGNSVAPPSAPRFNSSQARAVTSNGSVASDFKDSPTWFIDGARNQLRPNEPVGEILGRHRYVPPLAARGTIETEGNNQFARQIFDWGYGPVVLSDLKIGETLLTEFNDVQVSHNLDGEGLPSVDLFTQSYDVDDLSIGLDTAFATRTTAMGVDEIIIDVTFSSGLVQFDDQNNKGSYSVVFEVGYSPAGANSWTSSNHTVSASSTAAIRQSFRFSVAKGQYDVRVRRTSGASVDIRVRDEVVWTALKSVTYETPVLEEGLAVTALRIKATEQLNGLVDQLNAVVSKEVLDWDADTEEWVERFTDNPASLVRYIWTSPYNEEAVAIEDIDLPALQEWHEYCAAKGFSFNAAIDYETTVDQIIRDICAAGRGAPECVNGKYTVIVDSPKALVTQHFTPRNSSDYQLEIIYPDECHAFRVQFINREKGWQQDVITVYDDGYDKNNASKFERLELFGVTDPQAAYKLAREHIASIRLRPETHSFLTDAESLPLMRGDRIYFSHDVPLVGLCSGRIKSVATADGNVTGVTVDEPCPMEAGKNYYFRIRKANGESLYKKVVTADGNQSVLSFSEPFSTDDAPGAGDIYTFGEEGKETLDLMVQRIEYQADFAARIFAVNYNEAIYQASEGPIPSFDPGMTVPPSFRRPLPPELVGVQSDEGVQILNLDGSISSRMVIRLNNRNAVPVDPVVKIRLTGSGEYIDASVVSRSDKQVIIEGLDEGAYYDLLIYYKRLGEATLGSNLFSAGLPLNGVRFVGNSSPPPDVDDFNITVRGNNVFLDWSAVQVVDIAGFEVRFQPVITGAAWSNGLPTGPRLGRDTLSTTAPHRIGTYMIKAIDRQDNYSVNATLAVTTIGQLDGLNQLAEVPEHESWGGTFAGTLADDGNLMLGGADMIDDWADIDSIGLWDYGEGSVATTGYYYFENTVDLGEVDTPVLSADIEVSGTNIFDEIDQWSDIDSRESWDGADPSQYNVVLEVRTTPDDPNADPVWSGWRPLRTLSEYAGRGFQFRLLLQSYVTDISPVVSACTVKVDATDRFVSADDVASGTGGQPIVFSTAFSSSCNPAIAISADDMDTGDYYLITGKSAAGFTIEFFNASAVSVDRTFSYVARGFGRAS